MRRTIKSYVLRAGRMTLRQKTGFEVHLPKFELPLNEGEWSFEKIFSRQAPTILEIGFGMGQSLREMAQNHPENNYIGVEVHRAGVGALASDIAEFELSNLRLVCGDAIQVLKECVPNDALQGVQIFFPDPWPKKKHHKRRLIQKEFIDMILPKLVSGGFIHCATDWQEYAEHILEVLSAETTLRNSSETNDYVERPETRPLTKFENRGNKLGHGVWDVLFFKQ